jgi:transcriptional regulator with XRE-family HTH domain
MTVPKKGKSMNDKDRDKVDMACLAFVDNLLFAVKEEMEDQCISQNELAKMIGVSPGTVSRWFNAVWNKRAVRSFRIDVMIRMLYVLDMSIEYDFQQHFFILPMAYRDRYINWRKKDP